jgi:hypothetical protein
VKRVDLVWHGEDVGRPHRGDELGGQLYSGGRVYLLSQPLLPLRLGQQAVALWAQALLESTREPFAIDDREEVFVARTLIRWHRSTRELGPLLAYSNIPNT